VIKTALTVEVRDGMSRVFTPLVRLEDTWRDRG
jgi:hypothetical protein